MDLRALILGLAALFSASAAAEDYSAEAQKIASEIIDTHPLGRAFAEAPDFIAARTALFKIAGDADLPHYAVALGRLFHTADDGHTMAILFRTDAPAFSRRYPFRLKRFEDGLYVVAAKGAAEPLLGARLTRVAGRDVNEILRAFVKTAGGGNSAWPANFAPFALSSPGYLIGLDIATDALTAPVRFEGVAPGGRKVSALLEAADDGDQNLTDVSRKPSPLEGLGGGAVNFAAEIDHGAALALVIGAMENSDDKSFNAFTDEAAALLKSTRADRVVIDLRDNGGGNNMLAEPLRRLLVKSRFNRHGGIYVLISPQTFSAAMNFATRLERETDAIFVGEPTGGRPNQYGDPHFTRAAQSKIPYIISTLYWQDSTPFDARPWILPDLPAAPKFDDYLKGRDLALERALADSPNTEFDWRKAARLPWARPSQNAEWRFFYEKSG